MDKVLRFKYEAIRGTRKKKFVDKNTDFKIQKSFINIVKEPTPIRILILATLPGENGGPSKVIAAKISQNINIFAKKILTFIRKD